MWFQGPPSPQEAEAVGLFQALKFLQEKNFSSVDVEMDCLSVMNDVNNNTTINIEICVTFSHCKTIIAQFHSYRISYIRREANLVAHSLARASRLMLALMIMILVQIVYQHYLQ